MKYKLYKNDFPATLNFKKIVAIDTETMGLNLNRDRLCLVQVCFGDNVAHLIQFSKNSKLFLEPSSCWSFIEENLPAAKATAQLSL